MSAGRWRNSAILLKIPLGTGCERLIQRRLGQRTTYRSCLFFAKLRFTLFTPNQISLLACDLASLELAVENPKDLEEQLGAPIAADWDDFAPAMKVSRDKLRANSALLGWWTHLVLAGHRLSSQRCVATRDLLTPRVSLKSRMAQPRYSEGKV